MKVMSTERAIEDLVHRFVDDILNIVHQVQEDARTSTLRALRGHAPVASPSLLPLARRATRAKAPPPKPAPRPAPAPAPARGREAPRPRPAPPALRAAAPAPQRAPSRRPAPAPSAAPASVSAPPRARARRSPLPKRASAPPPAPTGPDATLVETALSSERPPEQPVPVREAAVLDAVRFLVRASAGEIANRCGLPNGTVYVVLRSLMADGRVARTETATGSEYSLISAGGIHPFRRQSTAPPAPAREAVSAADSAADSAAPAAASAGE